ncbi:hypothetical protein HK096_009943 [Nowakowskiella sp. JEL0078]|nr:hypothetical protein HK096_009943 [Nowakowskiella sp. JEL0078]
MNASKSRSSMPTLHTFLGCLPLKPSAIFLSVFYLFFGLTYFVLETLVASSVIPATQSSHWILAILASIGATPLTRYGLFVGYVSAFVAWSIWGMSAIINEHARLVKVYCWGLSAMLTVDGFGQFALIIFELVAGKEFTAGVIVMYLVMALNFFVGSYFLLVLWSYCSDLNARFDQTLPSFSEKSLEKIKVPQSAVVDFRE